MPRKWQNSSDNSAGTSLKHRFVDDTNTDKPEPRSSALRRNRTAFCFPCEGFTSQCYRRATVDDNWLVQCRDCGNQRESIPGNHTNNLSRDA